MLLVRLCETALGRAFFGLSGVSAIESFPHHTLRAEVPTQGRHPCSHDPGLVPMFV